MHLSLYSAAILRKVQRVYELADIETVDLVPSCLRCELAPIDDIFFTIVDSIFQREIVGMTEGTVMFSLGKLHPEEVIRNHQFFSFGRYLVQGGSAGDNQGQCVALLSGS
jgi:hypothetical protein